MAQRPSPVPPPDPSRVPSAGAPGAGAPGGPPPGGPPRPDPRGRSLPVHKLWLDGRLTAVLDATLAVETAGTSWRVEARLPEHDPFARTYGLSVQLDDGRALHGRVRLVAARDGAVVFEGHDPPEGGWV